MKKLTNQDIEKVTAKYGYPYKRVKAVIAVESGGIGFAKDTGKIIIQFEPSWFKRKAPYTPSGKWSLNGVERQSKEWEAFNDAFAKNANAAMESTSIGMMQVMGFHYKSLGFKSVGAMWDYAKVSEANQLDLGMRFIQMKPGLNSAMKSGNAAKFAYGYNGEQYEKYNYDTRLIAAGF